MRYNIALPIVTMASMAIAAVVPAVIGEPAPIAHSPPAVVERATRPSPHPGNAHIFNAWTLLGCVNQCEDIHGADPVKLYGHTAFSQLSPGEDAFLDGATFQMCTRAYSRCNDDCQESYHQLMANWPGEATKWVFHTSSNLTTGINRCNAHAANDDRRLTAGVMPPHNLVRDGTFAYCNQQISDCVRSAQVMYGAEMKEWEENIYDE